MKTQSIDATGRYSIPPAFESDYRLYEIKSKCGNHGRKRRGNLLALGILGAVVFAHGASAALTQATIYETPATAPAGGLWLNDQTKAGGHLWVSDHINGFCRVDPPAVAGGTAAINPQTCYNFGLGGAAGQPAFDPVHNFVYLPDLSAKSQGVTRLDFDPVSGTVIPDTIVAPFAGIAGDKPTAVALGPDGNLYVAFRKNGNIVRLTNPGCVDTATISCAAIQQKVSVGTDSDGRRVVSIAFVGNDLYLAETNLLTRMRNAPLCTGACKAVQTVTVLQPQSLAYDGKYLYAGNTTDVWRMAVIPGGNPTLPVSYATGFAFVSGIVVKKATLASPTPAVYSADDPSGGITPNSGRWWTMPSLP